MIKKPFYRVIFILFVVALATAVTSLSTRAHASVARSDPADNAVLDEAPRQARIWYTEPVAVDFSAFRMLDINGQPVKLESIRLDEADHKIITLDLPELAPGVYSIHWNVLSEADGHDTQGVIAFGIGSEADVSAAQTGTVETAVPWGEVALRWVNFSLLAAIIGALAIRYLVLAKSEGDPEIGAAIQEAQDRLLTWTIRFAIGAIVVGFFLFFYQIVTLLQTLPDDAAFLGTGWKLISLSRWGDLWLARQGILLALFSSLRLLQANRRRSEALVGGTAALLAVALTVVQALNSHAAAVASQKNLAVAIDALHIIGVGLWLGGLLALIIGLFPIIRRDRAQFMALARAGWGSFGLIATFSVILIILTGIYNTGRQAATLDALISTVYGQALLSKIGLMLAMGAFGLLNSMALHPGVAAPLARLLGRPQGWRPLSLRRLPQLVRIEMALGIAVLLSAGLITASANPQGPEYMPFDEGALLGSMTESVDDMLISFSAKPNKPGQNVFLIRATSTRRPAPAEVMRVITRLTYLDEEIGTTTVDAQEIDEGQYHIGGSYFSLSGLWQVEVAVRRRGVEDTVARFEWVVPPPGEPRPVILSDRPLQPVMTWLAIVGLGIVLVIAGFVTVRRRKTAVQPNPPVRKTMQVSAMSGSFAERQTLAVQAYILQIKQGEKNETLLV